MSEGAAGERAGTSARAQRWTARSEARARPPAGVPNCGGAGPGASGCRPTSSQGMHGLLGLSPRFERCWPYRRASRGRSRWGAPGQGQGRLLAAQRLHGRARRTRLGSSQLGARLWRELRFRVGEQVLGGGAAGKSWSLAGGAAGRRPHPLARRGAQLGTGANFPQVTFIEALPAGSRGTGVWLGASGPTPKACPALVLAGPRREMVGDCGD